MRPVLWSVAAVAVLVWTAAAWLLATAVGQAAEISEWLAHRLTDWPPAQAWLREAGTLIEPVGAALVWTLWGAGVALLAGGAALGAWLLSKPARG